MLTTVEKQLQRLNLQQTNSRKISAMSAYHQRFSQNWNLNNEILTKQNASNLDLKIRLFVSRPSPQKFTRSPLPFSRSKCCCDEIFSTSCVIEAKPVIVPPLSCTLPMYGKTQIRWPIICVVILTRAMKKATNQCSFECDYWLVYTWPANISVKPETICLIWHTFLHYRWKFRCFLWVKI